MADQHLQLERAVIPLSRIIAPIMGRARTMRVAY